MVIKPKGLRIPSRKECANSLRILSLDAVQRARSGHIGMPLGMADIAEVLWRDFLRHDPADPTWMDRDRFVLSNGHGSMLLYALLHLSGYSGVQIRDIKDFRQLGSDTPGHPEFGLTPGVEATTGPLGQGLANAVGMAIAERKMAAEFNYPNFPIVNHFTYVFVGDGCLMEGISHEACSFAGNQKLGKLIVIYDDNGISIDGSTKGWFTDDTPKRFESYGWHVIDKVDGHHSESIHAAIKQAQEITDKPSLLCCQTIIAYGSPNCAGDAKTHGGPFSDKEAQAIREALNWPHSPFHIPQEYYYAWDSMERNSKMRKAWSLLWRNYALKHPEMALELKRRVDKVVPDEVWDGTLGGLYEEAEKEESMPTREASKICIEHLREVLPEFIGGSADLGGSTGTMWSGCQIMSPDNPGGDYIHYGVREFAMSAIMTGIALHEGCLPFGGTFLVFSDYARSAVRLAAMMKRRVIFVYTHDSIGVGEDGPTHQPVEHLNMLRMTPGLAVWRPSDLTEMIFAWRDAIEEVDRPTCIICSRQQVEAIPRNRGRILLIRRGAYIIRDVRNTPRVILIASGSELPLACKVYARMVRMKIKTRVVAMPCTHLFDQQTEEYKESILLHNQKILRVAIEAGSSSFWYKYVGLDGHVIGIDTYGRSGSAESLAQNYGFALYDVINEVKRLLEKQDAT